MVQLPGHMESQARLVAMEVCADIALHCLEPSPQVKESA